ncbi:MAG: TIGR02391 family protein [Lachnospiraceae bacterium]|nr:TIGR02391 family protein [Lachnospiraceae bacterium]MDE7239112.1 TIGR02391 family protein [Lachnospiraceae bacterium]
MNEHLNFLYNWFSEADSHPQFPNQQFSLLTVINVKQELNQLSQDISQTDPFYSKEFMRLKDRLFNSFGVNPAIHGMTFGYITSLYEKQKQPFNDIWDYIHPKIQKVSKGQYLSGFYADAAENAFKEINARTKRIYANACPNTPIPDGAAAMTKVYSSNNPIVEFCDRHTESGQNTQLGFMKMAEGAMIALRNPVAHENLNMSQDDAMRQLMFASMIMYKIDEGVIYSGITEHE